MTNPPSEVGTTWRSASVCGGGTCVEVATDVDTVRVRDSKDPQRTPMEFTHDEWRDFLVGVRLGEFDLPEQGGPSE